MNSVNNKPWLEWSEDKLLWKTEYVTRFTGRYLQPLIEDGECYFIGDHDEAFKIWVFEQEGFIERALQGGWQISEYGERWVREKAWTADVTDTPLLKRAWLTYSANRIPNHRIKKPFVYDGRLWIAVGGLGLGKNLKKVDCYQIVDPIDYHGDPPIRDKDVTYFGKYGYMGAVLYHGKTSYVMTGHRLVIHRGEPMPQQQTLFEMAAVR